MLLLLRASSLHLPLVWIQMNALQFCGCVRSAIWPASVVCRPLVGRSWVGSPTVACSVSRRTRQRFSAQRLMPCAAQR